MKNKKKAHIGHWSLPFLIQESNGISPIKVLMTGFHTPGKHDEDTKPDIVLVTEPNIRESIPFPGQDLPKLTAAINCCSVEKGLVNKSFMLASKVSLREEIYRQFDFNKMELIDALNLVSKHGENWNVPYEESVSDFRVLKGGYSYSERYGHGKNKITQLIVVGKDIRKSVPVILLKKSFNNFAEMMWLWDGGKRLMAGLFFLVLYPPLGDVFTFLSESELKMNMKDWIRVLSEQEFVQVDIHKKIPDLLSDINIDPI